MRAGLRNLGILGAFLFVCNLLSAGCSSLIAYSGQDVEKLKTKDQVHESFGTPSKAGNADGNEFEEYLTRRKISEPTVAGVCFIVGVQSLGLFELWDFPASALRTVWTTLFGQTLRFEYGSNGEIREVRINDTPMKNRARLP